MQGEETEVPISGRSLCNLMYADLLIMEFVREQN